MQDFEKLQAAWAEEKQEDMYTINHDALSKTIRAKKIGANRMSDLVEKVILTINLLLSAGLIILNLVKREAGWFNYGILTIMLALAAYVIYVRMQRLRASGTFDRSLTGDLDQAISDTRHRVRISRMGLLYIPFIAGFSILHLWAEDKPLWIIGLLSIFFVITFLAGRWEHKNWHKGRLNQLEQLQQELEESDSLIV